MLTGCDRKGLLCVLILALLNTPLLAQVNDWDDVTKEELRMQVYPADSNASAVILFDKAEVDLNKNLEYVMERHVRIKILREEGYKWASAEISFNDDMDQYVSGIRGHTFTLEENGDIQKHKLDKDDIFEEDLNRGFKRYRFTLPGLQPGAVTEYKYRKLIGSPYLLPDWEFQKEIPVAWSEYRVKIPDWFFYSKMFVGTHPIHIEESEPFVDRKRYTMKERSGFYTVQTNYRQAYIDVRGNANRWVMKDLPAVKELPYMTSVDDYKSKLWMQLTEIRIPREPPQYFLKSWSDVAKELREFDSFGGQLKSRNEFKPVINQFVYNESDTTALIQKIYEFVDESMVWDGSHSIFAENDITDAWEAKKGGSAEINLLLVHLLREAGLQANPVLISTRDHGKIFEFSAMANQFNHVIASVTVGEDIYLLDATSGDSSIEMLPLKDLNGNGLLVADDSEGWVTLEPRRKTNTTVTLSANITKEGLINGNVSVSSKGYDAWKEEAKLEEMDESDYIDDIFNNNFTEGAVDSFTVNRAEAGSDEHKYELFLSEIRPEQSQKAGELLYLNPVFFLRQQENPFAQPERKIPVDFPHRYQSKYVANFVVPENYQIEEVPEPKILTLPGGAAELRWLTQVHQNRITILSTLSIKKRTFMPEEYQGLRNFFSHVVNTHNERIVLREKSSSPESGE